MLPYKNKNAIEAGMDEAGRGPLIGRVYVAVVIWPKNITPETDPICKNVIDSKKLSKKKREDIESYIKNTAEDYAIEFAEPQEIDEKNILNAVIDAWHRAIDKLKITPEHLLIDGNRFKQYKDIDHTCVKGGDAKYLSIAAASILAKVEHDRHILNLLEENNHLEKYGIRTNMGYGTKKHMDAINNYGISEFHRKSFTINSKKNSRKKL